MEHSDKFFFVHYAEVGLKGRNRIYFEKKLARNIRLSLRGTGYEEVKPLHDRIAIYLNPDTDIPAIEKRLKKVMGVAHYEIVVRTSKDIDAIKETAFQLTNGKEFETLKVETKRTDKSFPLTSPEISREVGGYVIQKTGTSADMHNPDLRFWINLTHNETYIYTDKLRGVGGLPVGVSGKVLVMLSGGIDSPVAAWQMIKRGTKAVFIHFYSYPYTESNYRSELYLVPFAELQQTIVTETPAPYRVLLYRRMMTRIAQRVASLADAEALVTGESLAQVASQTLPNLRSIEVVAEIPILRPLIGFDKVEIIAKAEEIETFDVSTLPHDDCCSLFVPKHPATHATQVELDKAEEGLDIKALVEVALNGLEKQIVSFSYED